MTARRTGPVIRIRAIGKGTVEFSSSSGDYAVRQAVADLAAPSMRAPAGRGVLVRQDAAADVLALLEARNFTIEAHL